MYDLDSAHLSDLRAMVADERTKCDRKEDLVDYDGVHPSSDFFANAVCLIFAGASEQVDCEVEERKAKTVVGTGLGDDDVAHVGGNMLLGVSSRRDRVGEHRISRGNCGCDAETFEKGQIRDEAPDHSAVANQAVVMMPKRRMLSESFSRHKYAFGRDITAEEHLNADDDAGESVGDIVCLFGVAPADRSTQLSTYGPTMIPP